MRSLLAVLNVLGSLLLFCGALYALPAVTAVLYGETGTAVTFIAGGLLAALIGLALRFATQRFREQLKARDGYLLITAGWLLVTAVAALPLMREIPGLSFSDAYFEAMSGLTTTGVTTLSHVELLPHSVNIWRHALQWFGGMAIIVLAVAIMPLLGVGGMQVNRADAPGIVKDVRLTPRITQTARALWLVYLGLTVLCVLGLLLAGMSFFDAICHAFTVMSLGGFSTHDASVAWFHSGRIEFVSGLFLLIAAVNFSTHFAAVRKGQPSLYLHDPEARWMLIWIGVSITALSIYVWQSGVYPSLGAALRYVSFSVISLATTSGLVSVDYSTWPLFVPMWMLLLGSVTSSTGSPGGGIKMFRALVLLKQSMREMFVLVHPQAVAPLKIAGSVIPNRAVYSVLAFIFVYFMTLVLLTLALLASGLDFTSAFTAVLSSLNNAGPGLGIVGPGHSWWALSDFQAWVCIAAMFLGRIELFTALVLFTPAFWRK
jgi:trk system potassium uptake protein TrkH